TQSLEVYKASASVAAELISSMGLDLDWIDIGGGFFGSPSGDPTFDQYVSVIRDELAGTVDIDRTQLIVEPGGSLIAVPIEFHAQVIDVKAIGDQPYSETAASQPARDPLCRRTRKYAIRVDRAGEATAPCRTCPEQAICGFTCMEHDRLTVLKDAQELKAGHRIVFYRVGAYSMSYQSPFIESPPAVYVRRGDSVDLVRRKGTTDDYLRGSTWTEAALPEPVPAHTEGR